MTAQRPVTDPGEPAVRARTNPNAGLIRVGRGFGVPIYITRGWLATTALIAVGYAGLLRDEVRGLSVPGSYLLAVSYALLLGLCVVAHELGHTVVSHAVGVPVRRIVVFLLGGVSEFDGDATRPRDEFAVAAAGPAVSAVLAGIAWLLTLLPLPPALAELGTLMLWSNLAIVGFNLLPGLPLDGGRLVQSVVWAAARSRFAGAKVGAWAGRAVALVVGLGVLFQQVLRHSAGNATEAELLVTVAVGCAVSAFLWAGAGQSLRVTILSQRASELAWWHLIRPAVYVPGDTPLSTAVEVVRTSGAAGIVVVDSHGRCRGVVREADVRRTTAERRPWVTVAELATSLQPGSVLPDGQDGGELWRAVQQHPGSEYLITAADGSARGVLSTSDLARALGLQPAPRSTAR